MNVPTLFLVGATHRTAPFGFRERLALNAETEAALAADLGQIRAVTEFVVLNTCNRIEIYGVATEAAAARRVTDAFCALRHVDPVEFARFGFTRTGAGVVRHLLHVTAGLDSQMIGETEIFGQAKRAYAVAQTRGSTGPILNRLFQKAFQSAKHVRTHAGVSLGQVSVANVAVDFASACGGDLAAAQVVVLGAGEMAEKAARAFQSRGAHRLAIASRRFERAAELARTLDADAFPFEQRGARLADADIVVCSTSAPSAIVTRAAVESAMAQRPARPLILIDLAMPRDVEAGAVEVPNVFVRNLDDLAQIAARNREARQAGAEAGRAALLPKTEALWAQLQLQLTTLTAPEAVAVAAV